MNPQQKQESAQPPEKFSGLKTRKKIHWRTRLASKQTICSFDACCPIGTTVLYAGRESRTQSHGGMGCESEPVVFIEGVETPVPIGLLVIPGVVVTNGRAKTKQANEASPSDNPDTFQQSNLNFD